MQVELIDPSVWPFAAGKTITLARVLDSNPEYALILCDGCRMLVTKAAIRKAQMPQTKSPAAPLQWGAIVTLKDGRKVICTHPNIEVDGMWRGIPFGYKSPHEIHYTEITSIRHSEELNAA